MLDNGAFSAWTKNVPMDWEGWARWAEEWLAYPTTWAVLPDVVDGGVDANDRLLQTYMSVGLQTGQGAPVWHLHEPLDRLRLLCDRWPRVCMGSSGEYRDVGSPAWHRRVSDAFDAIASPAGRVPWVHMLRGLRFAEGPYPFASADSTNVAQNHSRPENTARSLADRWDALQPPALWERSGQLELEAQEC